LPPVCACEGRVPRSQWNHRWFRARTSRVLAALKQSMQRLGKRIAGCVSAVIKGHVARRYPATIGVPLTIQVDSYDTPRLEVDILLAKMQNEFDKSPETQEELRSGRFTS